MRWRCCATCDTRGRKETESGGGASLRMAVRHRSRIESIMVNIADSSHRVLILDVEFALAHAVSCTLPGTLRDTIAEWDAALLLCGDSTRASVLDGLLNTDVAPRIAFATASVPSSENGVLVPLALQIGQLVSSCDFRSRTSMAHIPSEIWGRVELLPAVWRRAVRSALTNPGDWDSNRLAYECCTTVRTIQRGMQRAGLPGPAALLRLLRQRCRESVAKSDCAFANKTPTSDPVTPRDR
jgi:hypothetical protein